MRRVRRRQCCMLLGCRNRNPLFFFSLGSCNGPVVLCWMLLEIRSLSSELFLVACRVVPDHTLEALAPIKRKAWLSLVSRFQCRVHCGSAAFWAGDRVLEGEGRSMS